MVLSMILFDLKACLLFFNPDNFLGDILYIKAQFIERGEWGRHLELSKIFLRDKEFYINYRSFQRTAMQLSKITADQNKFLLKH